MATFTKRTTKTKGVVWTGQIRISRKGQPVYTESFSNAKKSIVQAWAARREAELNLPGALDRVQHRGVTIGQVLTWYKEDYHSIKPFGRTKLDHINFLIASPLAQLDAIALTTGQLVGWIRERRKTGITGATVSNDLTWLRVAFRSVRVGRGVPLDMQVVEDAGFVCRKEGLVAKPRKRSRRPSRSEA
jgi:hypothetical protein